MDKFDLSGIATQNWHKNVKFIPENQHEKSIWKSRFFLGDFLRQLHLNVEKAVNPDEKINRS